MGNLKSQNLKAAFLSAILLLMIVGVWAILTTPAKKVEAELSPAQMEYIRLMGKDPIAEQHTKSSFPRPMEMAQTIYTQLSHPFYDNGPNDKGIGIQIAYSLGRVAIGFGMAALIAIPLGFLIGMNPMAYKVLDPFIQILKPISPLAWMPIALYTIKDSTASGIFVIFICSVWPMLMNTAFGVAAVRKEWINVAKTLEVSQLRKAFLVILPAAAPTIVTGMRISMGIAWLVIVAAEMLVGGTGIGYFVWSQWNNLSLSNVIFAILMIGVVGMILDMFFVQIQKAVTYVD
jgi:nitrate/nitrite transport system permease protein